MGPLELALLALMMTASSYCWMRALASWPVWARALVGAWLAGVWCILATAAVPADWVWVWRVVWVMASVGGALVGLMRSEDDG